MDIERLLAAATSARDHAHAEYSSYRVGAAILTMNGRIFTGCNIENASLGLTICAERVALHKAISEGMRDIEAIAVVSDDVPPARPCGACRQVLSEFADDMRIICANLEGVVDEFRLTDLLPEAFRRRRSD